jgi:uncharacterized protein (DUF488 family)
MSSIFTIGYQGASLDSLVNALVRNRIESVVDVRLTPLSRRAGFSRRVLENELRRRGIRYSHRPELGCPKEIRVRYSESGDFGWYSRAYARLVLSRRQRQIAQLAREARQRRTCLLCVEHDANKCHRSLVAFSAAEINHSVLALEHLVVHA